jgi:preprotein translocase subunit SecD
MKRIIQIMAVCLIAVALTPGCKSSPQRHVGATRPVFQLRLVLESPSADSEQIALTTKSVDHARTETLNVQKTVLLDQTALRSAKSSMDSLGQPVIDINFTDDGGKRFAEVTRQNINRRLAIIIDGVLYQAPVIRTEILAGKAQISGSFSKQEATDLVAKINQSLRR